MGRIGGDDFLGASNDETTMSSEDNPFVEAHEVDDPGPAGFLMCDEVWGLMVPEYRQDGDGGRPCPADAEEGEQTVHVGVAVKEFGV